LAADYAYLTKSLHEFYDFANKVVLLIGAGHGQLLDPVIPTKRLIAVDQDLGALKQYEKKMAAASRLDSVELVHAKFEDLTVHSDVVYFEFCLHEMADPFASIRRARALAPDVVVFDHSPDSEWVFHGAEEEIVGRSALAMKNFGIRRSSVLHTAQRFRSRAELFSKLAAQGPLAIERAESLTAVANIVIPMDCELVLL
jgi:ubiquinone/menaquinone biosynthesis C-methylase UbiE